MRHVITCRKYLEKKDEREEREGGERERECVCVCEREKEREKGEERREETLPFALRSRVETCRSFGPTVDLRGSTPHTTHPPITQHSKTHNISGDT